MYYMKAERYNGQLILEHVQGFKDESVVLLEVEFLKEIHDMDDSEVTYGIIDYDVFDVLSNAFDIL